MIYAKDVQKAVALFRRNPYWREYYDGAPTERLKEWIGYQFYYSSSGIPEDEVVECMRRLEEELNWQEWEYLLRYAGNNPFKLKCRRMMERLKQAEEEKQ